MANNEVLMGVEINHRTQQIQVKTMVSAMMMAVLITKFPRSKGPAAGGPTTNRWFGRCQMPCKKPTTRLACKAPY